MASLVETLAPMRPRGVWDGPAFPLLLAGQTTSELGSQVTLVALPVTAATLLGAGPLHMGLLEAIQFLPAVILGVFAGLLADRWPRRKLMLLSHIGRAGLLLLLSLAALTGVLHLWIVFGVAFGLGVFGIIFDTAYRAYLPSVVDQWDLGAANGLLESGSSLATTAGPALGGVLVQAVSAPMAVLADAASYVIAALSLAPSPNDDVRTWAQSSSRRTPLEDIWQGVCVLARHSLLAPLTLCAATLTLFENIQVAVFALYVLRQLDLGVMGVALGYAAIGPGALVGSVLASRGSRRYGPGPVLVAAPLVAALGLLLVAATALLPVGQFAVLVLGDALLGGAVSLYIVNFMSLRQMTVPNELLGRVNATCRTAVTAMVPIGAVLGGALAEVVGVPTTLLVAGVGMLLAPLWLLRSPIPWLRAFPELSTATQR
jgi:MFS family permease